MSKEVTLRLCEECSIKKARLETWKSVRSHQAVVMVALTRTAVEVVRGGQICGIF